MTMSKKKFDKNQRIDNQKKGFDWNDKKPR